METDEQRDETDVAEETPEEFAEEVENDPARNPDDEEAKRTKGG